MSMTREERSALLKLRNQRRLNWADMEANLRSLGLAASRLTDEQQDQLKSRFWSLDPCAALTPNDDWAREIGQFARDHFSVLVGLPWDPDDQPIARVAGPPLAAKCDRLLDHFVDGLFVADPEGRHFYFVDVNEDPASGRLVVETASLKATNA